MDGTTFGDMSTGSTAKKTAEKTTKKAAEKVAGTAKAAKAKIPLRNRDSLNNWFSKIFGGAYDDALENVAFRENFLKTNKIPYQLVDNEFIMQQDAINKADDILKAQKARPLESGTLGATLKQTMRNHPFKTAGIVGGGLANIAGLFDNDKIGGQLLGGAAGTFIPWLMSASPSTMALVGLGGGALGALFDNLRAAQEEAYANQMQMKGGY